LLIVSNESRMPARSIRIGRSRTGLGLFATAVIRRGKEIVGYTGRRIRNDSAEAKERLGAKYMFELDDKWTIDGSPRSNLGRYANHACRPNAEAVLVGGRAIVLRALRRIEPDEEITYNYGREYFNSIIRPMGCKCAACVRKRARKRKLSRARHRANGKSG
jgi:SET domain-containing protein